MAAEAMVRLDSRDAAHAWLLLQRPRGLVADSRRVRAGDAFIAWPGQTTDARRHVASALAAGATACLVEAEGVETFGFEGKGQVAALRGLKAAAGDIASRFFGTPSARLEVVAVTGTNGKTSTTWWIVQALAALGRRGAVIGTLGIGDPTAPDGLRATGLTTPDPVTLQAALTDLADRGFEVCAIEASSIGIAEHRLVGTAVRIAVFTNFTQDHLDYHGDMAAYWQAKAQLFAWPGLGAAIVNIDDAQGAELAASLSLAGRRAAPSPDAPPRGAASEASVGAPGKTIDCWTVSTRGEARLRATAPRHDAAGLAFEVHEGAHRVSVATPLIGAFNVANLLSVIGVLRALGVGLDAAARACAALTPVPGRMERVGAAGVAAPEVVIDYAHTPDALEKTLASLRPLAAGRGGRLWCVFGCGGNRDAAKRPLMGAIACRLADRVVVTSDNPRLESADFIISQILAGAIGHDEIDVIENRAEAIAHAVGSAAQEDVVLLAGKGHEDYQDVAGNKLPFSDHAHARAALRLRAAPATAPEAAADARPMLSLAEAAALLPGAQQLGDPRLAFARVHSDSRTLRPGDLFVALRGERFDGHDFLARAKAAGAVGALAERGLADAGMPGIEVADSLAGLGALAAAWRRRFALPMVAVTGSNGKTTVTQMMASMLRAWQGDAAFATVGNFNNEIGLPLTLLRLRAGHRVGVVELGMNHAGEIARLAAMAAPSVALVNNAQREHLEFMRDVAAVARENGAAIEALPAGGTAVFPADDAHAATWRAQAARRPILTFALSGAADVSAAASWQEGRWQIALATPAGPVDAVLRMAGQHNLRNALAAATAAFAAGCPLAAIAEGLERFEAVAGRSQMKRLQKGGVARTLVDDSYNANPDSVRAAVDVLAALPAPRWLILGDMGEIGDQGPALHREVGAYAHAKGIDALWAVGAESANTALPFPGARSFADVEPMIAALGEAPDFAAVLVKGSRFMRMERVVAALAGQAPGDAHAA